MCYIYEQELHLQHGYASALAWIFFALIAIVVLVQHRFPRTGGEMSMKTAAWHMSARKTVGNTVYHIFMVTLSVIMIYPFIWSLLSCTKSSQLSLWQCVAVDLDSKPFDENWRLFQCCL